MPSSRRAVADWSIWSYLPVLFTIATVWLQGIGSAQTQKLDTGEEIFRAACIGCHGVDGKGAPEQSTGFTRPSTFPDFSDCNGTTREREADWSAVIHYGGPMRGFSEIMPSFTEALTAEQIGKLARHLRTLCREPNWPRGELNLPRAMITDKAFPEDEAVLTTTVNAKGAPGITHDLVYERRFGVRNQIEVALPFTSQRIGPGEWANGIGDITLGFKRNLASSMRTGSIVSISGEVNLPTGDKARGLGTGTAVFETFATYGQILPRDSFLQFQGGAELPADTADAPRAVFWRTAIGKSFSKGMGRLWSPMVELLADRELVSGEKTNWDLLPQFQVTLSRRQHIRAALGVRFPVTNTVSRPVQVMLYVLWDWFDGGLREGWR